MKRSLMWMLFAAAPLLVQAADANDNQLIERAVRDYIESQHKPDPERMERALDPKLAKRTYWQAADGSEFIMNTDRDTMVKVARNYNKDGTRRSSTCYGSTMIPRAKSATSDPSEGWDAIAADFLAARSDIGSGVVRQWAKTLRPGGDVVDIGCGSGVPVSLALIEAGFKVYGIDASPTLLAAFRHRFPDMPAACEAAQDSTFFGRQFDGAIAVGLLFLLAAEDQRKLIARVGQALKPGGRFLFTAPRSPCEWPDLQTGRQSLSLGEEEYRRLLAAAGMRVIDSYVDEGDNYYFQASSCGR